MYYKFHCDICDSHFRLTIKKLGNQATFCREYNTTEKDNLTYYYITRSKRCTSVGVIG